MKLTRRSLKQSGSALEQAVRRDMAGAIGQAMDAAVFNGTGANGQPSGVIAAQRAMESPRRQSTPRHLRRVPRGVAAFMVGNAASGPGAVRAMIRPELWDFLDDTLITGTAVSEWDRLTRQMTNIALTSNGLAAPSGTPEATTALLTTTSGGVAPFFVGLGARWT